MVLYMNTAFPVKLKEYSLGFLKSTLDVALFTLAFGAGVALAGSKDPRRVWEAAEWAQEVNVDSFVRAFARLREKGYIKRNLTMTREGQQRLQAMFPHPRTYAAHWNGTWYLVSFDVPEQLGWKRNYLRQTLKQLGFGKLHASLWITPYNFLGDVRVYCKHEHLGEYVILATSHELGTQRSKELADRVFHLDALNNDYALLCSAPKAHPPLAEAVKHSTENPQEEFEFFVRYCALVQQDPFLPKPLLPHPWYGHTAHRMFAQTFH